MDAWLGSGGNGPLHMYLSQSHTASWWSQVLHSHLGDSSACAVLALPQWLPEGPGAWECGLEGGCSEGRDQQQTGGANIIFAFVMGQALFTIQPLCHIFIIYSSNHTLR